MMNTAVNQEPEQRTLSTADFAAAGKPDGDGRHEGDAPVQLFPPDMAGDFRSRWDAVQIGFVDDPRKAVREADELVAQVMKNLADSFANERTRLESQMGQDGGASTEDLRVALQRYRSFFHRLLSL